MLQELKSDLQDIYYSYFDTYTVLLNIIHNPADYGMIKFIIFYRFKILLG